MNLYDSPREPVGSAISFFLRRSFANDNRDKMENGKKNLFHSFETIDILKSNRHNDNRRQKSCRTNLTKKRKTSLYFVILLTLPCVK